MRWLDYYQHWKERKKKMIKNIIKELSENEMLPIGMFENILHVYYQGSWYAIEENQYKYFSPLKSIIDEIVKNLKRLIMEVECND